MEDPHGRDGQHENAARVVDHVHRAQLEPTRLAKDDVLQRPHLPRCVIGFHPNDLRAQPADRARSHLDDDGNRGRDADLHVHRAVLQAERCHGIACGVDDRSLSRVIEPRRCHVDRLLEEWTGQRIGFVEDRDHLENSLVHKAFEGYLNPVHVAFHKHRGHRSVGADLAKQ
ncbi:MAG: hypothetical protein WB805_00150 [Candidatus Dormiibacterota bacterium]